MGAVLLTGVLHGFGFGLGFIVAAVPFAWFIDGLRKAAKGHAETAQARLDAERDRLNAERAAS